MDILEHWKNKEKFNEPCRGIQPNPAMGNWPPHYSTTTHCASKTAFIKNEKNEIIIIIIIIIITIIIIIKQV